jgi:hypothetical protein
MRYNDSVILRISRPARKVVGIPDPTGEASVSREPVRYMKSEPQTWKKALRWNILATTINLDQFWINLFFLDTIMWPQSCSSFEDITSMCGHVVMKCLAMYN